MKYIFEMRAVPSPDVSIEEKHSRFITGIRGLPSPWGCVSEPAAPEIAAALNVGVSARSFLGKGVAGDVNYHFRGDLQNLARCDDFLWFSFNPKKVDLRRFATDVLPGYVAAFGPYRGGIFDQEVTYHDCDTPSWRQDERVSVHRLPLLGYLSQTLCRAAFGLGVDEVASRLGDLATTCWLADGGIYYVLTEEVLSTEQMLKVTTAATRRLRGES